MTMRELTALAMPAPHRDTDHTTVPQVQPPMCPYARYTPYFLFLLIFICVCISPHVHSLFILLALSFFTLLLLSFVPFVSQCFLSSLLLFSLCLPSHSLTLTLPKASNVLATAAAHSLTCSPWLRISQFIFLCPSVESFQPELSGFESGPYRLMIHSLTRLSYYFIALFWGTCSYFVFIRC